MWTEGLFLTPQHLQQLDSYHEQLLDRRLGAATANVWGVSELEIDPDELARGIFRVSQCTAVMPDGLLVEIGEQQPLRGISAMTDGKLHGGDQTVGVYLGVPSRETGGVTPEGMPGGTRYVMSRTTISDAFGSAEPADVEIVRPNVQLLLGDEDRRNFVTLKLTELRVNEAGRLAINDRYMAPCLKVRSSRKVMEQLRRLVGALASKQKSLVSKYSDRVATMVEFGAADISTFWYLHTVNTWLPTFMHYAESGDVHPEPLYLALAAFAGQLSTFEATTDPLNLPRFNFLDLGSTFFPLLDRILHLLGTVVSSRYTPIPLEQTQPGLFVGRVDDPSLLHTHSLYLVAGGDVAEDALRDDVPRYLKIGSLEHIAQIVQSALPGITVHMDYSPPNAIPVRSHMVYLRLEKEGRYWDGVKQSGTIAIYQPVKPNQVKLELLAVEG